MGLYDRSYVRSGHGEHPSRSPWSVWSITTWIIVACVAVFVADTVLPTRAVLMNMALREGAEKIDRNLLRIEEIRPVRATPKGKPVLGEAAVTFEGMQVGVAVYKFMPLLESLLHYSTKRGFLEVQFWRLIGFQFLHSHEAVTHILFNMFGLFFFGPLVESHLGRKRFLAFYLLCGIFGALMYTLLNLGGFVATEFFGMQNAIPGLLFNDTATPLVGASAGVYGVIMAGAFLAPNARVLLMFFLPMRLSTMAYALVGLAIFTLLVQGNNAGGEAGHLGGAIAGFYFIRRSHTLHNFFDVLGRIDPTSHHYRGDGRGAKVRARAVAKNVPGPSAAERAEIDRILDKVHAHGLASLTESEKKILRRASGGGA